MPITIELSKGYKAIIDDEDAHLASFVWTAQDTGATVYAFRRDYSNGGKKRWLHREVMKYDGPLDVDHIDGEGLHNCRINLRVVTRNINCINRRRHIHSNIDARIMADGTRRYIAHIFNQGKRIHLVNTRSHIIARTLVEMNVARIIAGDHIVAFKREHRWAPLRRVFIPSLVESV